MHLLPTLAQTKTPYSPTTRSLPNTPIQCVRHICRVCGIRIGPPVGVSGNNVPGGGHNTGSTHFKNAVAVTFARKIVLVTLSD